MYIIKVKRKEHCRSPPVIGPNIIVQIHGQNISIDYNDTTSSLNYTVGTIASYKCKNSEPDATNDQQFLKCTHFLLKLKHFNYSWAPITKYAKDLDCGSNEGIFIRTISINLGNDAKLVRSK
jgi:hypothetical protein